MLADAATTAAIADVHARMGSIREDLQVRVSLVAVQAGGRRLIHQMHCSLPSVGQAEGESFPPPGD